MKIKKRWEENKVRKKVKEKKEYVALIKKGDRLLCDEEWLLNRFWLLNVLYLEGLIILIHKVRLDQIGQHVHLHA